MKQRKFSARSRMLATVAAVAALFVPAAAFANVVPAIFPVDVPGYIHAAPCASPAGSMVVVPWPYTLVEPLPPVAPAPSDVLYQAFYHPVTGPYFQDREVERTTRFPTPHKILSMDDVARLGYTKALLSLHKQGREYYLARNYGSAFKVFERAYLSMPNDFLAAYWAAMSALAHKNERLASEWIDRTLRVRPDFGPAWDIKYRKGL